MRKILLWTSTFGLAVVIGVGIAALSTGQAMAYYCGPGERLCAIPHWSTGPDCVCLNGLEGHYVQYWYGYCCPLDMYPSCSGGYYSTYCTNYSLISQYCSACPSEKGPYPVIDPGE